MDVKGKCVIYIGGFGGIGRKCIEELLKKELAHLFIFDLATNDIYLSKLQKEFPNSIIEYVRVDMSMVETIKDAYKVVMDKTGGIDIVVNGSGILNERLIDLTVAINLTGVIHSNLIALNHMSKAKGGRGGLVVNIASLAGLENMPMTAVYGATKSGVINFTKSMAAYYECSGVNFIAVCPGATITPIVADLASKSTFPEYCEAILKTLGKQSVQTAEQCAQAFMKIVETADNGTIWTVLGGNFEK
ncbi:alcohol dehydrogenase-like, partial [Musca vetustissima]|uniref:alcohol dehydrogenase-like n=1 Tax=Musca vetustissima TaxID=27455 RepID=UPI002AB6EC50